MTRSKKRQAAVAADISNEASDDRHADGAKKRVTSRYWTPQEIQLLTELSGKPSTTWSLIARSFPGRTAKQCRERWASHHSSKNPRKKGGWTSEEDNKIRTMQKKYGNTWMKIAGFLEGRTANDVKNRWHSQQRCRERAKKNAPSKKNNAAVSSKKRKVSTREVEATITPMKTPKLEDIAAMNSSEFVEKEFDLPSSLNSGGNRVTLMSDEELLDLVSPPIPHSTCPTSMEAASSLLSLRTALAPGPNSIKRGHPHVSIRNKQCGPPSSAIKFTYPLPSEQPLVQGCASMKKEIPARKFTYPSPPSPVFIQRIKMEQSSPSMKTTIDKTVTSPNAIHPPYGSVRFTNETLLKTIHPNDDTPAEKIRPNHTDCQVTMMTLAAIKMTPIIAKTRNGRMRLFSPIQYSAMQA